MSLNLDSRRLTFADGSPRDPVCGIETEYGFTAKVDGSNFTDTLLVRTFGLFHRQQFKEDGDREYPDCMHPEISTAEDTDFLSTAHRKLVGDRKAAKQLVAKAEELELINAKLDLIANTSDKMGNSWGSHVNVLARRDLPFEDYVGALLVNNATRIVWSGAGHVQEGKTTGSIEFYLSEKAEHIWEEVGLHTTGSRPLVNTRDEPHASPLIYRRVHDTSGETVFSPFVNGLRSASLSIILKACAEGEYFDSLQLQKPVNAIKDISHDPTLKAKVYLANGRQLTGLEIQKEIAEKAMKATTGGRLTAQEQEWGEKWIELLDDLARDPLSCYKRLDWVIKQQLIEKALQKKQGNGKTDFDIAYGTSINYHRLLPYEGRGMELVRKGFFEGSPTEEVLENGLPLPQTRAKLRGESIKALNEALCGHSADWGIVKSNQHARKTFVLKDPYKTTHEPLEAFLASLVA